MASVYASNADFESYAAGWTTDSATELTKLLERAERDIDSIIGPWAVSYLVGSHTLPSGTVYVGDARDFPSAGTVNIGGQVVTYTGKTETTLTGATGGTGTFSGDTVVRKVNAASGLKFDPISQLSTAQALALKRATCAQADYRFTMGEEFFITAQYQQVAGPDFSHIGQLPRIGPKAYQELEGVGLIRGTCVG